MGLTSMSVADCLICESVELRQTNYLLKCVALYICFPSTMYHHLSQIAQNTTRFTSYLHLLMLATLASIMIIRALWREAPKSSLRLHTCIYRTTFYQSATTRDIKKFGINHGTSQISLTSHSAGFKNFISACRQK